MVAGGNAADGGAAGGNAADGASNASRSADPYALPPSALAVVHSRASEESAAVGSAINGGGGGRGAAGGGAAAVCMRGVSKSITNAPSNGRKISSPNTQTTGLFKVSKPFGGIKDHTAANVYNRVPTPRTIPRRCCDQHRPREYFTVLPTRCTRPRG